MKKLFSVFLLVLIMTPVFVFANGEKEAAKSDGPVEIEFLAQWPISDSEEALMHEIEKKTNTKVTYTVVANQEQRDTIAARLASGDLPDLFFIEDVQAYKDAMLGDLLADFTKWSKDLNLTNIQDEMKVLDNTYGNIFKEDNGDYYRLPARRMKAYGWYWVYRADWAKEAGVTYDAYNPQGFIEFVNAMKANHPNSVGLTAYGSWGPLTAFAAAYSKGMPVQWNRPNLNQDKNGNWYAIETTDGFREGVEYLNDLYTQGVLDPEIFSMDRDTATQKFIQGKSAVLMANSPFADALTQAFYGANPNGKMDSFEIAPQGPEGGARGGSTGYYKNWVVAKNSDEKTAAAMKFLNELKSAETKALATRPEKWKLSSGGEGNHTWTEWTGIVEMDWDNADPTMAKGLRNADNEVDVINPLYDGYSTDISMQYKPEVASVMEEYINNFIVGKLDVRNDSVWKQYLNAVDKAGLPIILEDITNYYK
ncbi:MAG: extracellular solute-binding protein [Sphaerochaetaceae bacterium]|nr:extracellular solute-binding protein [Sphaerochaetaceae bacterium]